MADRDFAAFRPIANSIRVRAATTANISIATALNSGDTLDGVTLEDGMLVLVKNQNTAAENGIYVVGTVPRRYVDFSTDVRGATGAYDMHPGLLVAVEQGATNADTIWQCTSDRGGTLGTTALAFAQITPSGGPSAFALTLLDDANAAAARGTLGSTTIGDALFTAANAAAARATLEIETGTFTPTMAFATPGTSSFVYTQQAGRYFKVANWYIVQLVLQVTPTIGTGSGEIRIGGLPAVAITNSQPGVFGTFGGSLLTWPASRTQLVPLFRLGQPYMVLEGHGSAQSGTSVVAANLSGGSNVLIRLSGAYET